MRKYIKKINKVSIITVLVFVFMFGLLGGLAVALAPGAVHLGTAGSFAVLAGTGITDSNPSDVTGMLAHHQPLQIIYRTEK